MEVQEWEIPPEPQLIINNTIVNAPSQNQITPTVFTVPDGNFTLLREDGWDADVALGSRGPLSVTVTEESLWDEMQGDVGTEPGDVWSGDYEEAKEQLDYVEANLLGYIALLESLTLTKEGEEQLVQLRRTLTQELPEARQELEQEHLGEEEAAANNPYCTGKLNSITGNVEHSGRCNVHDLGTN